MERSQELGGGGGTCSPGMDKSSLAPAYGHFEPANKEAARSFWFVIFWPAADPNPSNATHGLSPARTRRKGVSRGARGWIGRRKGLWLRTMPLAGLCE